MAPILIDSRELLKLAIISVLCMIFAFSGGYFFGFKQAMLDASYQAVSKSQIESKHLFASNYEAPEVVNVDANKALSQSRDKSMEKTELTADQKTAVETEAALEILSNTATKKKNDVTEENHVILSANTDETYSSNVKFTIQIAVYDSLKNAESMMLSLQKKNLDAYVSGYTSKSGKRQFNVRFGYFQEKKMALSALKNYINEHQGDGYLVNFSSENIVSFVKKVIANDTNNDSSEDASVKAEGSQ